MPTEHIHKGHRARLRERFLRDGLSSLTDREALELLLTYAIPRRDVDEEAAARLDCIDQLAKSFASDGRVCEMAFHAAGELIFGELREQIRK